MDAFVESASGSVMIWRLPADGRTDDEERIERVERSVQKLVAGSLVLLAAYRRRGDPLRPQASGVGASEGGAMPAAIRRPSVARLRRTSARPTQGRIRCGSLAGPRTWLMVTERPGSGSVSVALALVDLTVDDWRPRVGTRRRIIDILVSWSDQR